jgi:glutathione S-transferase
MRAFDVTTAWLGAIVRFGVGMRVCAVGARPAKLLELYEFEGCPFCRKAREALSLFDLDAKVLPCPKGGKRFRPEVVRRGGKASFPFLVDPNAGIELYESDAIVRHLATAYGDGRVPASLALSEALASAVRGTAGSRARPSRAPAQPLELWSYEASPYSRLAREALCALELPYVLHNVAGGSAKREALSARAGKVQVPYLADPNTGTAMFESADIVRYLEKTYAA